MSAAFAVGFFIRRKDKEVIHIDDEPPFSDHVMKGVIHESLKCGWRVSESEEHDGGFK